MSFPSWPFYDPQQIQAVCDVLSSSKVNSWTGDVTSQFESEFSVWSSSKFSVALANGSLALSSAYLSIGLGQGDEFITTPRSFVATASSGVLLGAKPVFAMFILNLVQLQLIP